MIKLCNKDECTGCCACQSICPKDAISMSIDKFGFRHPQINHELCIQCKRCIKVCPSMNDLNKNNIIRTFASLTKNSKMYHDSTSGGIATAISEYFIDNDGVVYGASFDSKMHLKHIRIKNKNDLYKIQGSKYIQSDISEVYASIKNDIQSTIVLFIGTPCQVSGLSLYFKNNIHKRNLYLISFICGGVPSEKFLFESIKSNQSQINNIKFRQGPLYGLWIHSKSKKEIYIKRDNSNFYRGFDKKIILRESCYNCNFATLERIGDITIGDFWGLKYGDFIKYINSGVSIIVTSTEKGDSLINKLSKYLDLEPHKIEETIKDNPRIVSKPSKSFKQLIFRKLYPILGFNTSINLILGLTYLKYSIKNYFKQFKILEIIYGNIKRHTVRNKK